jgi:hypothetical protein
LTLCADALRLQRVSMMQMNPHEDEAGGENERDPCCAFLFNP